jgi:hypothetical protein
MQGCPRLLDSMDRCVVLLRSRRRDQRDRSGTGGEQLQRRVDLPAAAFWENPSACRAGVEGGCLGELPGGEAELPWALAGLGCGGATGPRRSRGAARRSKRPVVLGIRGGCSAAVGHKGV